MQIFTTLSRLLGAPSDPFAELKQSIRDLEDHVPELNRVLLELKSLADQSQRELVRLRDLDAELGRKIAVAQSRGRTDRATHYEQAQADARREIAHETSQHALARTAFERALAEKRAFMDRREQTIVEAKESLLTERHANRIAELLKDLADCTPPVSSGDAQSRATARAAHALGAANTAIDRLASEELSRKELEALVRESRSELSALNLKLGTATARLNTLEKLLNDLR